MIILIILALVLLVWFVWWLIAGGTVVIAAFFAALFGVGRGAAAGVRAAREQDINKPVSPRIAKMQSDTERMKAERAARREARRQKKEKN